MTHINLTGMYTEYLMASEAVYELDKFAETLQDMLVEHSEADSRWDVRLKKARQLMRRLRQEITPLWEEWARETGEIE